MARKTKQGTATTFTAKAVCAAVGLSHGTLNSWAHSGLFKKFTSAATTPGKARQFTHEDIVRLAVIKRLTVFGIAPSRAAQLASDLVYFAAAYGPLMTEFNYRVHDHGEESALPNDGLVSPPQRTDALLKLTIYTEPLFADLLDKLGEPETVTEPEEPIKSTKRPPRAKRRKSS